MGLTTQYHKYLSAGFCGLIGSPKSNIVWLSLDKTTSKYCAVGACENVIIWDTRKQEQLFVIPGDKHEVVRLASSPNHKHLAVGYHNGTIKIFDLRSREEIIMFSGHKTAVTALTFDNNGMILASGARDTDIIIWDIVSESGLYRLKGHKGQITELLFLKQKNVLISSSKDTYVKFWDLDTQHCFRTLLTHKTEVYGLAVNKEESRLYTGSSDNEIRSFILKYLETGEQENSSSDQTDLPAPHTKRSRLDSNDAGSSSGLDENNSDDEEEEERMISCKFHGSMIRQSRGRTVGLHIDDKHNALICHGTDKSVELFEVLSEEAKSKLLTKRASKARKRQRATLETGEGAEVDTSAMLALSAEDEVRRHEVIRLPFKSASVDIRCKTEDKCQVVSLLSNNSIHKLTVDLTDRKSTPSKTSHLTLPGHRTDCRALAFSNDGMAIASASAEHVKIWNRDTLKCVRTMSCGYALCCAFLPGDRHIVVGCKSGTLQLFDISSSELIEEIEAHTAALWSLCVFPDKRGLVSGSADHEVKFWQFELVSDNPDDSSDDESNQKQSSQRRLTLTANRVLKMSDDVLCVKISADNKYLAVSLLDHTIKVFFTDTLKFFLSLYGHSLPALSIDISTDSTLLVSGSADKNVKIWGLDFGDCHRSLFAHDDNVMGVSFVPKTHLFFTCGKDGAVKQWDADTFQHITTLQPPHHGEVWSIATSADGMSVASTAHDHSLRVWDKSEEILVLEEERQDEREAEFEAEIEREDNPVVPGEVNNEVAFAGKKTVESVKSTERIMEALEVWRSEKDKKVTNESDLHPLLRAYKCSKPEDYVLEVLIKIKASELEESLLVLPFDYATDLLTLLDQFIRADKRIELVSKSLLFLLRIHHNQITSNNMLLCNIDNLRQSACTKAQQLKDRMGFNQMALQMLALKLEERNSSNLWADATSLFKEREKKKKKRNKGKLV